MGIKRIVDTSFWTDRKVDDFSPEDKYFMLYLLTNPFSTQLGIYEFSIKQVAFQMGYSTDAVKVLIDRFENKYDIIVFSEKTNEIAIKNFLRHSIIKGGAPVRDCLIKEMRNVKNKDLIAKVFLHIKDSESLNETVKNIIAEYEQKNGTLYYSNEKQNDNENENENDNDVSYHDSHNESYNESFPEPPKKIDYQEIIDMFNSICTSLPSVRSLSDARKKAIKARLNTYTIEDLKQCFENAEASSFLKGGNIRNWTASFDWLMKDTNIAKVLDGNYNDKSSGESSGSSFSTDDFFNKAVQRSCSPRAALEREAAARMEEKAKQSSLFSTTSLSFAVLLLNAQHLTPVIHLKQAKRLQKLLVTKMPFLLKTTAQFA